MTQQQKMDKALEVVGGLSVAYWSFVVYKVLTAKTQVSTMPGTGPPLKISFKDRVVVTDIVLKAKLFGGDAMSLARTACKFIER